MNKFKYGEWFYLASMERSNRPQRFQWTNTATQQQWLDNGLIFREELAAKLAGLQAVSACKEYSESYHKLLSKLGYD